MGERPGTTSAMTQNPQRHANNSQYHSSPYRYQDSRAPPGSPQQLRWQGNHCQDALSLSKNPGNAQAPLRRSNRRPMNAIEEQYGPKKKKAKSAAEHHSQIQSHHDLQAPENALPQNNTEWKIAKYRINPKRAFNKKLKASNRDQACTFQEIGEGLNFSCQAGMYELLRRAACTFYANFNRAGLSCFPTIHTDLDASIVQVTFRLKTYGGQISYSLDMYHTNSSIRLSGRNQQKFVELDWPKITGIIKEINDLRPTTDPETLNHNIKKCLEHILANSTKPPAQVTNKPAAIQDNSSYAPPYAQVALQQSTVRAPPCAMGGTEMMATSPEQTRHLDHGPHDESRSLNGKQDEELAGQNHIQENTTPTRGVINPATAVTMRASRTTPQQLRWQGGSLENAQAYLSPNPGEASRTYTTPEPLAVPPTYSGRQILPVASPQQLRWQGSDPVPVSETLPQNADSYRDTEQVHPWVTSHQDRLCQSCDELRQLLNLKDREMEQMQKKLKQQEKALNQRERELQAKSLQYANSRAHIEALENQLKQTQESNRILNDRLAATQHAPPPPERPSSNQAMPSPEPLMEQRLRTMEQQLQDMKIKHMEEKLTQFESRLNSLSSQPQNTGTHSHSQSVDDRGCQRHLPSNLGGRGVTQLQYQNPEQSPYIPQMRHETDFDPNLVRAAGSMRHPLFPMQTGLPLFYSQYTPPGYTQVRPNFPTTSASQAHTRLHFPTPNQVRPTPKQAGPNQHNVDTRRDIQQNHQEQRATTDMPKHREALNILTPPTISTHQQQPQDTERRE